MKVADLSPRPQVRELFRLAQMRFVPERSGCYVLATFEEEILYVGLATNLRRRFRQHLDTPEKVKATANGRASWFYWLECADLEKLERTWLNTHALAHGGWPILNKVYSPTAV
ncbi:GIY-YIG nuclease family protein [Brucella pseudintermedia]|uniref:GIY-YIG nuclease family protein n=1 Tax=Brucella pseudintermedia TaxID=370111 RepID=UPI0030F3A9B5